MATKALKTVHSTGKYCFMHVLKLHSCDHNSVYFRELLVGSGHAARGKRQQRNTPRQVAIIDYPTPKKETKDRRADKINIDRNKTPTLRVLSRERTSEYLRKKEIEVSFWHFYVY